MRLQGIQCVRKGGKLVLHSVFSSSVVEKKRDITGNAAGLTSSNARTVNMVDGIALPGRNYNLTDIVSLPMVPGNFSGPCAARYIRRKTSPASIFTA